MKNIEKDFASTESREAINQGLLDENYIINIQEELILLPDYVPFAIMTSKTAIEKPKLRKQMSYEDQQRIRKQYTKYKINISKVLIEDRLKFVMEDIMDFINKYPQFKGIVIENQEKSYSDGYAIT